MAATANPVVHNNPLRPGVGWALSLKVEGAFEDGDILIATMRRHFSGSETHEVMRAPVPADGLLTIIVDGERNATWKPAVYILELGYQRGTAAGVFFSKIQIAAEDTNVNVGAAVDPLLAPGGTPIQLLVGVPTAPAITVTLEAGIQGGQGDKGETGDITADAQVALDDIALKAEQTAADAEATEAARVAAAAAALQSGTAKVDAQTAAAAAAASKAAIDAAIASGETAPALAVRTDVLEAIVPALAVRTDVLEEKVPALDSRAQAVESVVGSAESQTRAFAIVDSDYNVIAEFSGDAKTFKVVAAALSLLTNGTARLARHDGASAVDLRADGVALPGIVAGTLPSATTDFALMDEDGFWVLRALAGGAGIQAGGLTFRLVNGVAQIAGPDGATVFEAKTGGVSTLAGTDYQLVTRSDIVFGVADAEGFIGWAIGLDGKMLSAGTSAVAYATEEILAFDDDARSYSEGLRASIDTTTARMIWAYSLVLAYGQSLCFGNEGWPALSKVARRGNLMIGNSLRPTTAAGSSWSAVGTAAFNPLVATVRATNGSLLSDAEAAALTAGADNEGETVLEGAVNFFKKLWDQDRGLKSDASHLIVAATCGSPGKSVEELSKGASPDLYGRVGSCATLAKSLATGLGKDIGMLAMFWLGGEQNYNAASSSAHDKVGYKAALKQLIADIRVDVQVGVLGQADPFGLITYQTGGSYTADTNDLAIGMAQLELSNEEPNWFLAAPNYPVVDKGGHLTSNGYRWLGKQFGKVLYWLSRGWIWKPLQPLKAKVRGKTLLVSFHVPAPPIAFGLPYIMTATQDYADKGFTLIDGSGVVPIVSVDIVAPRVLRLNLARATTGSVAIRYADKTYHNGTGNICDSDRTVSDDAYEYTAGTGQYASENILALIGKPYSLQNWCVAGHWPVTVEA